MGADRTPLGCSMVGWLAGRAWGDMGTRSYGCGGHKSARCVRGDVGAGPHVSGCGAQSCTSVGSKTSFALADLGDAVTVGETPAAAGGELGSYISEKSTGETCPGETSGGSCGVAGASAPTGVAVPMSCSESVSGVYGGNSPSSSSSIAESLQDPLPGCSVFALGCKVGAPLTGHCRPGAASGRKSPLAIQPRSCLSLATGPAKSFSSYVRTVLPDPHERWWPKASRSIC